MPAAEAPTDAMSRAEAQPPWQIQEIPPQRYKLREWWSLEHGLKSWDMADGITFGCFLVSLLFSSSLLWISALYKWRWHGFLSPPDHRQVEVEFPRSPDPLNGRHWASPTGNMTYDFVWVRPQRECIMLSILSFSLVRFMHPRRSAPKERDHIMATRNCGRVMAILYGRLATRLRSVAIILPIHPYTITSVHVCNRIPRTTICTCTRPTTRMLPYNRIPSTITHWLYMGSQVTIRG